MILTSGSVDEILECYHSNETSSAVLSHDTFYIGLFQKKSTPPRRMARWKFSREGGSRALEIQVGGGDLDLKLFLGGH